MKKTILLLTISFFLSIDSHYVLSEELPEPKENEVTENEVTNNDEAALMSLADKVYADRLAKIKEEREKETNRFKKKAIADTEAREQKHAEALQRKKDKASRFQKEAWEEAEKEKQEILEKAQHPSSSRFTEIAKQRAEARALKRELREQRLHRNKE